MTGRALNIGSTTASARARLRDGIWLGALGVLCFSGTAPATRIAAPVFGASVLTWSRIMIAACLGAIVLAASRQLRWPGWKWIPWLIVAGLGQAVGYPLFLALAVERVPAYHGAVVIGLAPAATAVVAALREKERPRPRFWLACGIGFATVLIFAIGQGGGRLQTADGWLVAAVLSTAVGYVEGGRISRAIGAVPTLCWAMILLSPVAAVALAVLVPTHHVGPLTASAWISFGYVGVASMFLGSTVWFAALAIGGTARIGQLNLAQPFLAISWSALLLSERLTWAVPATATVVLACMAICLNTGTPPSPDQNSQRPTTPRKPSR